MPLVKHVPPIATITGDLKAPGDAGLSTWTNPHAGLIAGPTPVRAGDLTPQEQIMTDIHVLDGPKHTTSGKTPGHFLKATGPAAFAFQPHGLTSTDVGAAPATQGVAGGNAHAHTGGQGAQVAHTNLSAIGTNTHAQIDTAIAAANATTRIGPAATLSAFNTCILFSPATTNVIVSPYPLAGWTPGNSGGSAVTQTFQFVNNVPEMLLTGITQVTSYPRLTDTAWTPAITGPISISFEAYSNTPGAEIRLYLYESRSTKHGFIFSITTGWTRYTGYISSPFNINQPYFGYFTTGAEYHIRRIQVENLAAATAFYPGTRTPEDLVIGQNLKLLKANTLTLPAMATPGFVRNSATGLLSGGQALQTGDIPADIGTPLSNDYPLPRWRGLLADAPSTDLRDGDMYINTAWNVLWVYSATLSQWIQCTYPPV